MQWCQTQILPMIREANISYNLIQTGNAEAGAQICRERSPVTSSGVSQNGRTTPGS